jgi:hypothetical protein
MPIDWRHLRNLRALPNLQSTSRLPLTSHTERNVAKPEIPWHRDDENCAVLAACRSGVT